jgi:uncharacterized SAM-binding protein YcdF (DUF218 family)
MATIAFVLKKLITACILPPGIFIVACLVIACLTRKKARFSVLLLGAAMYAGSIGPVGEILLRPLERSYPVPTLAEVAKSDVYVVLGGGANDLASTIDGKGIPSPDALYRVMAAYRLYLLEKKPIIISGGDYLGREPEAEIAKRYLLSLGVDKDYVITESKARDTYENALFTRKICEERSFRRVLLITSAYHMRRSVMLFDRLFGPVTPFPAGFRVSGTTDFLSFLPDAGSTLVVAMALREYMGILFYKIKL